MRKRLLPLLLTVVLAIMLTLPGAAANHPFSDVSSSHWGSNAVTALYQNGIMNGTSSKTFTPRGIFTRAMFVTMLGRLEGVNPAKYPVSGFSDVAAGSWYAPYVTWAAQNGIVKGTSSITFSPNDPITREQYCTIVDRYLRNKGLLKGAYKSFAGKDAGDVSSFAAGPVGDLLAYGLCNTYTREGSRVMLPRHGMTRIEVAGLFWNLCLFLENRAFGFYPPDGNPSGLYAADYLGMTVAETNKIYGTEIKYGEGLWFGGTKPFSYDGAPYTFGFTASSYHVTQATGKEKINMVVLNDGHNVWITEKIHSSFHYRDVAALGYPGSPLWTESSGQESWYGFEWGATAGASFQLPGQIGMQMMWFDGRNPYTTAPDLILLSCG